MFKLILNNFLLLLTILMLSSCTSTPIINDGNNTNGIYYTQPIKPVFNKLDFNDPKAQVYVAEWVDKVKCRQSKTPSILITRLVAINSKRNNLDPYTVMGLIKQESCFVSTAKSSVGALGLTQVMPMYHHKKIKGRSLYNPAVSIEVGTDIMKEYIILNKSVHKGLVMYSGGASNYNGKVTRFRKDLITYVSKRIKESNHYLIASN